MVGSTSRLAGTPPGFVRVLDECPSLGIRISIEEAYTQCPKALIRSDLWNRGPSDMRAGRGSTSPVARAENGTS
jgi:hypothetical protein